MRKITLVLFTVLLALFATTTFSCSKKQEVKSNSDDKGKMIVCYFSATGTTEKQAQRIAELTGAEIMEILPDKLYTDADLNWRDSLSRSSVEMADASSRPALKTPSVNLADYDVVFIGYPNWWNTCPRIINTFVEAANLNGKIVVPFMTSGGSNITNSEKELSEAYPDINWKKGLLMNDVSDEQIKEWIKIVND